MHARGFTLIEVVLGAAIFSVIAGIGLGLVMTGQQSYSTSTHQMHASTRASAVMERILEEVRHASVSGEDIDNDDDPDDLDSHDRNGNGRIDDDWSLADGETAQELAFNVVGNNAVISDRIAFRFDGERVWRVAGSTNPEPIPIANDVTALTFTRQGKRIVINVVVSSGVVAESAEEHDRGGRQVSLVREILLRN
ncbi:MAG: prepilin-type N-terminal cleavage/methylation domain-containing protein [Planctomycetota bacterium]|jgi:prepilin-type N-terminal cleavage/methylation domain-containing protein